ncbi:MAG: GNAT family N-acetyltransferase [Planctomycetes bacterium]|nr:GNAT family N-acetyltransferase [Planctomycetota bacterium]
MSQAAPRNVARALEWDTQFFGVRIASLEAEDIAPGQWRAALEFCRAHAVRCLYVLAAGTHDAQKALDAGAVRTDERVTLALGQRALVAPASRIRGAVEVDIPALRALAARSHTDSRFYADGHFARERCDELYATWIEKSVRGWADAVYTSGPAGAPLCYLSLHQRETHVEIGLIAVDEATRGQGLGRELVEAALTRAAQAGLGVRVVTQGRNAAATSLYGKCGFEVERVQSWFHLWFDDLP